MQVDVGHRVVGEEAADHLFQQPPLDHVGIDHHAALVEGADRQQALAQLLGNLADRVVSPLALAHIDGMARAVRRVGILVLVVDQDDLVARLGVGQADAAGIAGVLRYPAHGAVALQRCVVQGEQVLEGLGGQAGNAERHGPLLGFPMLPSVPGGGTCDAPVLARGHEFSYGCLMRSILTIAPKTLNSLGQRFWYRWYLPAA